jgi:hypothetical protein
VRYPDTVDRFIAGGPVADVDLRMVRRNTMQSPRQTRDAPVYRQLARNPGSQRDICPAAASRQRSSAERPADPGDRPAARGCAGPGRIAVPCHNAARWRIRRRRTIRTLSERYRVHPAQPSITTAPALRPAPIGLRTATRNACSAFQNRVERRIGMPDGRIASAGDRQADLLVMALPCPAVPARSRFAGWRVANGGQDDVLRRVWRPHTRRAWRGG